MATKTTLPKNINLGGSTSGPTKGGTGDAKGSAANAQINAIIAAANEQSGVPAQEVDPTSDTAGTAYVPQIVQNNPYSDATAWNLPTSGTASPSSMLYVGNGNLTSTSLDENHLVANIATHLGIKITNKSTQTLEEMIAAKAPPSAIRAGGDGPGVNYLLMAQSLGLPTVGKTTGAAQTKQVGQVLNSLRNNPTLLSGIQQELYEGGFYSGSFYGDPTQLPYSAGHMDTATKEALGTAVRYTMALNSSKPQEQQLTLHEAVAQVAYETAGSGGPQQWEGGGPAKIPYATEAQLSIPLQTNMDEQLGMLPDQAQLQQFTSEFDASQAAHANPAIGSVSEQQGPAANSGISAATSPGEEYGTGITLVPGMPSSATAATEFAQSSDPTQYMAHRYANAYGMMLNSVVGNRGEQVPLPGYNPNATEATSTV